MSNPQGVFVEFYTEAVEFKAESEKEGRPIFREIPFIRIQHPGDRNNVLEVKVTDHYKQKYAREWREFEARGAVEVTGTLLSQWPPVTKSQVKEAEYFGIRTVEQLAAVNDAALQKIGMGWRELRTKAQAFIGAAHDNAAQSAQAAENERLRNEIESLKASFKAMQADEPKRGRSRKEETAETL